MLTKLKFSPVFSTLDVGGPNSNQLQTKMKARAWRPKVKPGRKVSDDKTSVGPVEDKTRNEETFSSIPIIICGKLGSVTDNRRRRWAFVPTSCVSGNGIVNY
ncbi:hypothetical protein Moror_10084 [Moniliophthora roreri MCA 2997]|uniref:Uncharacterized protein n=1 Tax=Moniliophthora roreri (strain MCA 2997) TaxID=1381753 RepID=V2WVA7_MONRO|nr:hypothetical protein Moror_10084 [Moniliophthora roreri MCA 2997]